MTKFFSLSVYCCVLILLSILSTGCTTIIEVKGEAQPTVVAHERFPTRVAVVFRDSMGSAGENVRPSGFAGLYETLYFDYGDLLSDALFRSVVVAYKDVMRSLDTLATGEYERIIRFRIHGTNGSGTRPYLESANDQFSISVTMDVLDGKTMERRKRTTVKENVIYPGDPKSFEKAIEQAIQRLSDDVAKLLVAGFVESAGQ